MREGRPTEGDVSREKTLGSPELAMPGSMRAPPGLDQVQPEGQPRHAFATAAMSDRNQLRSKLRPPAQNSASTEAAASGECQRGRRRTRWRRLLVVLALLAVVVWFHKSILRAVARGLIVDSRRTHFDYLWIRSSDGIRADGDFCYDRAVGLYSGNRCQGILVSQPCPSRLVQTEVVPCFETVARRELVGRGVPEEAILVLDGQSEDLWQDAGRIGSWLEDHADTRVLLVCERLESRRCRFVLDAVLGPERSARVGILGLPDEQYDETNWWKCRSGCKDLFYGYVGLAYSWWMGENRPERTKWDPDEYERGLIRLREGAE